MAKYPPKFLKSQPNRRTRAHRHVKVKLSKNRKMEAMEVNAIMEKLDRSDRNGHCSKNNINHFLQLYGFDNEKCTKQRKKPKTPIIVLTEKEKGRKKKGGQKQEQ